MSRGGERREGETYGKTEIEQLKAENARLRRVVRALQEQRRYGGRAGLTIDVNEALDALGDVELLTGAPCTGV